MHALGFAGVHGHPGLGQHVLARVKRRQRDRAMQVGPGPDHDRVDTRDRRPGLPSCRRPWECRIRGRPAWPIRVGGCRPPTMRTPGIARNPGKCRVRVIWPAPTIPMRISPELIDRPIVSALTINNGSGSSPVLILWSQGSGCDVEAAARPRNCAQGRARHAATRCAISTR